MERETAADSETPTSVNAISTRPQQRLLLWIGLGGLLTLLITLGISAVSFLRTIESRHESIRADFLARMQVLVELRNNVYRSGTRVHDFLLDEPTSADRARLDILASRQRIEALEDEYARALRPEERDLFLSLRREVDIYFAAVIPVLDWTPADRERKVDVFVRDELHPRRSVMLRIADEIESLNAQDMDRNAADTKSLFVNYRRLLLALVSVTFVIGCVLALFSMWRMGRLENESETRFRQVEHAKAQLQALSITLVDAQESERRRLARELHDEVGQGLWAMVLGLGNATAALEHRQLDDVDAQLGVVRRIADELVRSVRNLALLLRPSVLDDLGLIPAIKWLGREIARTSDLHVDVLASGVPDDLREEYRTCVYRVVQEALHNCQRHAAATKAEVRIEQTHAVLHLTVTDDGGGFEPSQVRGLGLLGMEERVAHLGGIWRMRSSLGAGTVIDVQLPLRVASVVA
jgi:signal transduction histidine kinase